MIPYSRPKRSDLYTLSQSKLLKNHALHSGTYPYSSHMAVLWRDILLCRLLHLLTFFSRYFLADRSSSALQRVGRVAQ